LTVLSSDGASEVVRNGTRTVVEAGTTVKGLTGIDIPALISSAIGSAPWASGSSGPRPGGTSGTGGTPGGGGGTGTGGTGSRPKRPSGRGPAAGSQAGSERAAPGQPVTSAAEARAALDRAEESFARAGERIGHLDTPPPASPTGAPEPGGSRVAAAEAVTAAEAAALGAQASAAEVAGALSPVVPEARATAESAAREAATTAGEMTMSEAAHRLAAALQAVPGVDRYGALRLMELERSGPGPLRTLWHAAAGELESRYGDVTIGEFLDRARGRSSGGGATPTH
jgi:hypothetical protein